MSKILTKDQEKAYLSFTSWLKHNEPERHFLLSGFAGSGKTFLASKFLKLVEEHEISWTVAAPTHKAVDVLKKRLDLDNLRPTWYPATIHRLLRLKLKRKNNIEVCEETSKTLKSLFELGLVLIDESSMIDKNLLEILLQCSNASKTRLVFVGDQAQLPPVGEIVSPIFSIKNLLLNELHEVVRHEGPILRLANSIRGDLLPASPPSIYASSGDKTKVISTTREIWMNEAKKAICEASLKNNPDEARILCYTNKVLEKLIPHARKAIHGDMADNYPVLPGEVLISQKTIMSSASVDDSDIGEEPGVLLNANREMIVNDISSIEFDLQDLDLPFELINSRTIIDTLIANVTYSERSFSFRLLPQIGSSSRGLIDFILNKLSDMAKKSSKTSSKKYWKLFFLLRDSFASVSPASVLTVHRSQGSTFENVFIASDIYWPKDLSLRKQLIYVAVTRASKNLWLVGDTKVKDNNNMWNKFFSNS